MVGRSSHVWTSPYEYSYRTGGHGGPCTPHITRSVEALVCMCMYLHRLAPAKVMASLGAWLCFQSKYDKGHRFLFGRCRHLLSRLLPTRHRSVLVLEYLDTLASCCFQGDRHKPQKKNCTDATGIECHMGVHARLTGRWYVWYAMLAIRSTFFSQSVRDKCYGSMQYSGNGNAVPSLAAQLDWSRRSPPFSLDMASKVAFHLSCLVFFFSHLLTFFAIPSRSRGYISCEAAAKWQRPLVWAEHHCARSATRLALFLIISISVCRVMPCPSLAVDGDDG